MKKIRSLFWATIMLSGPLLFLLNYGCAPAFMYCRGNQFGDNKEMLRQLKEEYPEIKEIIKTERNFFKYSVITVIEENPKGEKVRKEYCLNTNIFLDHEFNECEKMN